MNACAHDHADGQGLHGGPLQAALDEAEQRCAGAGERLTPARRTVLRRLLESGQPMKAYDLMADFAGAGDAAKPPTVYRALEFLGRLGLVHRIESLNAYVACRLGETRHAAGFLICDCCGATREIEPLAAEAMRGAAEASGYVLTGVTVEAHGLCRDCAAA